MKHCLWLQCLGRSGGCVHLRDLSGHFCGHPQPLGWHIRAHARCPLGLFLTVGFDTQLLQPGRKKSRRSRSSPSARPSCMAPIHQPSTDPFIPFLVVFGSEVGLQVGRIDEVPPAGMWGEGKSEGVKSPRYAYLPGASSLPDIRF